MEMRTANFQMHDQRTSRYFTFEQFDYSLKPIEVDSATELLRLACFVKPAQ